MAKLPFKSDERFVEVGRPLKSGSILYSTVAEGLVHQQVTRVDAYVFGLPREPLSTRKQLPKRVLDVVISGFGLVALCPVMLIAAAIIRLDSSGPILFWQARSGFEGKPFRILKFRTMSVTEDGEVVIQATLKDVRVTRVGSFLRRTSIDELPQLLNVLRGDMSLVGPRPHAQAHDNAYEKLIVNYAQRHKMKPGITGWAQVNGFRGETPKLSLMQRRVELDLWYITNWSLALDLRIIIRTCFEVLRARNAF